MLGFGSRPFLLRAASVAVGLVGLVATTTPAVALADTPSPTATVVTPDALRAGYVITLPGGTKKTLPKNWENLSIADLAQLGIKPTPISGASAGSTDQVASGGGVTPQSASGSNQGTYINVVGSGLTVDSWTTHRVIKTYGCSFSVYWRPSGTIWHTGNEVCGNPGEIFQGYYPNVPIHFSGTTVICNTWATFAGKPCETVKK